MRRFFGAASASLQAVLTAATNPTKTPKQQEFITSGTFVVPTGVNWLSVFAVGGGGSGAAGTQQSSSGPGGAGGNGGYVNRNTVAVTPGETLTVTIGAGGAQVTTSGTAGNPGGATSLLRGTTVLLTAPGAEATPIPGQFATRTAQAAGVVSTGTGGRGSILSGSYENNFNGMPGTPGFDGFGGGGGGGCSAGGYGGTGAMGGGTGSSLSYSGQVATPGMNGTGSGGGGGCTDSGTIQTKHYGAAGGSGYLRLEWMQ